MSSKNFSINILTIDCLLISPSLLSSENPKKKINQSLEKSPTKKSGHSVFIKVNFVNGNMIENMRIQDEELLNFLAKIKAKVQVLDKTLLHNSQICGKLEYDSLF